MSAFLFVLLRAAAGTEEADEQYFYANTNFPPSATAVSCLDAAHNTSTVIDNATARCDFGASCRCVLCTKVANAGTNLSTAQYCVVGHVNASRDGGFDCAPFGATAESECEQAREETRNALLTALGACAGICVPFALMLLWCQWRRDRYGRHSTLS